MADQKLDIPHQLPQVQSRQPVAAIDTAVPTTESAAPTDTDGIQPIVSPLSPGKSQPKKTGTRSTFCPNTLRKGTKLTEEDYEHHESKDHQQPAGWLQMLGLKKCAHYGDGVDKSDEPLHQSYY
ncbi:hypothetical protein BGZ75_007914 [Mortierella antarctica]|nr:hypothetical protein BGZ67_006678 [Mortierella alpina]KAF9989004.1 hypothetical protein BGZ75_007914 [Mortierella antarctica]